jgi:hypothetical protein
MTDPAVYGRHLPAPNREVKIPDPPARSPTPPTKLVALKRGYKFTTEDQEYFHKFISWRLQQNPSLTRQEICELLAVKVRTLSLQLFQLNKCSA